MTTYRIVNSQEHIPIGKVICLARTYHKHAQEMQSEVPAEPILFLKPESSIIFSHQSIILPKMSTSVHYEIELGIVIGKQGKHIPEHKAMDYVFGYVVALDVTARDIQTVAKKKGWPWSIAKGFDTFAPISDVVLASPDIDPHHQQLILTVNGSIKQQSNTKYLSHSIPAILSFISQVMTLKRGDLILTGTPEGVGELHDGDTIEAKLGNLCSLVVTVKKQ